MFTADFLKPLGTIVTVLPPPAPRAAMAPRRFGERDLNQPLFWRRLAALITLLALPTPRNPRIYKNRRVALQQLRRRHAVRPQRAATLVAHPDARVQLASARRQRRFRIRSHLVVAVALRWEVHLRHVLLPLGHAVGARPYDVERVAAAV